MERFQAMLLVSPLVLLIGAGVALYIRKKKPEWQYSSAVFFCGFLCGLVFLGGLLVLM